MKNRTYITFITLIISMLCLTGHVMSEAISVRPSTANYGNTSVNSTVNAFCIGTFAVAHKTQWDQTSDKNGSINANPLKKGESRADYTYRELTLGYEGTANYLKDYSMNGGNVATELDNINVKHIIDFQGEPTKTGVLHFEEQDIMFGAGAAGAGDGSPLCIFATEEDDLGAYKGTITVGSQLDVREISAKMSIGSTGISDNPDTPVNLRYTFHATGLESDPKDDLATGSARVYSDVDMHIYDNTYDLHYTAPNVTGHFQDAQEQDVRGLVNLSTTFEYTN